MEIQILNDHLVLISGKTSTGKSASFRNLKDPEGVLYLNCENNKKLPFPAKFIQRTVIDPLQMYQAFPYAETKDEIHTIITDSLTYMMDMYESKYVLTATNTMKAWGDYSQFLKNLMNEYVAVSTKNVIFTAHTLDILNEVEMVRESMVKVKGSLMNNGIESMFSTVISTKKMTLKSLEKYESGLLNISEQEEILGFKYVFQTMLTRETVNERIRSPISMWTPQETFIDNDIQLVIDRLHEFY